MQKNTIEYIKELIAMQSTADNPDELQCVYAFMVDFVKKRNPDVTIEEFNSNHRPSFLAYRGSERPDKFRLILNAHLDVVPGRPEQFVPKIKDGKLYGRGAYDMKSAAIVMATVFCEYVDKMPFPLGLQVVTDEETAGHRGTKHQLEAGVRADLAICGECGRAEGTYEIANEAKGVVKVELRFRGQSAHGAYPWQGSNAALKAAEFVKKLTKLYPSHERPTASTTLSVIALSSDSDAHNRIPDSATVRLDCRYVAGDQNFQDRTSIAALIHNIDPAAEIADTLIIGLPMQTKPNNPLLSQLKAAAEKVEGHEFSFVRRNGSSDGRFYTEFGGEACELGIAGANQHGDHEYVPLQAIENYYQTLATFLQSQA